MFMKSSLIAGVMLIGLIACSHANAQTFSVEELSEAQFEQYERQLNAILLTRFDAEKEFVAIVVDQVRAGNLPTRLVSTSFQWVRNRRPGTRYPFVYFYRVLTLQSEKLDLDEFVPEFDFSTYGSGLGSTP